MATTKVGNDYYDSVTGKKLDIQPKKSSVWGKIGKVAAFAAPFIPIPGMAALSPLLQAGIRGGIGAASGAVAGGKKGALIGAGVGAGGSLLRTGLGSRGAPVGAPPTTGGPAAPPAPASSGLDFKKLAGLMGIQGGMNIAGSLIGGGDEGPHSFWGEKASNGMSVDPRDIMGAGMAALGQQLNARLQQQQQGVNLSNSYAQPVPGLSGRDPAYDDRSLLQYPGTKLKMPGQQPSNSPDDFQQVFDVFSMLGFPNPTQRR